MSIMSSSLLDMDSKIETKAPMPKTTEIKAKTSNIQTPSSVMATTEGNNRAEEND